MYFDRPITKENLNLYLRDLAKEFRRKNGKAVPAELIIIGGAAILLRYGFREVTYDVDAIIIASSAMKEAINATGDKHGLPNGWLNADFKRTSSYSDKLHQVSVYYKTLSNVLTIRTISAEYLIAMKLKSGRLYKNDLSDIAGILWEHARNNEPIFRESIENAIKMLYGDDTLPETSLAFLNEAFETGDLEQFYLISRKSEIEAKEAVIEYNQNQTKEVKEDSMENIIAMAKAEGNIKDKGKIKS